MDVLTMINSFFPSLTKSEQKVAQFVLINPQDIELLSIGELATQAEVAETTVIRFCRKIHFKGYQELKLALARDIAANKARKAEHSHSEYPLTEDYLVYIRQIEGIVTTDKIAKACEMIYNAKHICIFGVGTSGIVGSYLKAQLVRLGKQVSFDQDAHLQAINAAVLSDGDLVIAVSQSGNTNDILKNIKIAQQHQVSVLSLSNYLNSDLVHQSELALVAPPGSETEYSSFLPMMGQLTIIDILCRSIREKHSQELSAFKISINNALLERI